jgi:hypothetical protein
VAVDAAETTAGGKIPTTKPSSNRRGTFENLQIRTKSAIMNVMNAKRKSDDDAGGEKRKGRKKGFVWSHVLTDEEGKVTCMHCGDLIKVNFGEKVIIRPLVRSAFTFLMA